MLVKWSPVVILSYIFIKKRFIQKMKGDNSNPLKTKNND